MVFLPLDPGPRDDSTSTNLTAMSESISNGDEIIVQTISPHGSKLTKEILDTNMRNFFTATPPSPPRPSLPRRHLTNTDELVAREFKKHIGPYVYEALFVATFRLIRPDADQNVRIAFASTWPAVRQAWDRAEAYAAAYAASVAASWAARRDLIRRDPAVGLLHLICRFVSRWAVNDAITQFFLYIGFVNDMTQGMKNLVRLVWAAPYHVGGVMIRFSIRLWRLPPGVEKTPEEIWRQWVLAVQAQMDSYGSDRVPEFTGNITVEVEEPGKPPETITVATVDMTIDAIEPADGETEIAEQLEAGTLTEIEDDRGLR